MCMYVLFILMCSFCAWQLGSGEGGSLVRESGRGTRGGGMEGE